MLCPPQQPPHMVQEKAASGFEVEVIVGPRFGLTSDDLADALRFETPDVRKRRVPDDVPVIPTLVLVSILVFTIIELPPGDYFESYVAELLTQGEKPDSEQIEFLRQHGIETPVDDRCGIQRRNHDRHRPRGPLDQAVHRSDRRMTTATVSARMSRSRTSDQFTMYCRS